MRRWQTGADDLPPNGPYVIGAIARTAAPLSAIISQLGVSKQAAGQLVDTLVVRGFLERSVDPVDRRRLDVRLTARGKAAAGLVRSAVEAVDADLEETLGSERVHIARPVLARMIQGGSPGA